RPGRGDHPLDDAGRARQPGTDQGIAPQTHRQRLWDEDSAGQPAGQAVRPDAQDDAPYGQWKDAGSAAARPDHGGRAAPEDTQALTCRSPDGRTNQTKTRRVEEEPD